MELESRRRDEADAQECVIIFEVHYNYTGMDNLFGQPASSSLIACPGRCPRQVERNNYVPLFGVDTALRYYVIRDMIVLQILCFHW